MPKVRSQRKCLEINRLLEEIRPDVISYRETGLKKG